MSSSGASTTRVSKPRWRVLAAVVGLAALLAGPAIPQGFPDAEKVELERTAAFVPNAIRVARQFEASALRTAEDARLAAARGEQAAKRAKEGKQPGYGAVNVGKGKYYGQTKAGKPQGYGVENNQYGNRFAGHFDGGTFDFGSVERADGGRFEGFYFTVDDNGASVNYGGPKDNFVEERGQMLGGPGTLLGWGVTIMRDGRILVGYTRSRRINGSGAIFSPSGQVIEQGAFESGNLKLRSNFQLPTFAPAAKP
jgi:hypothetical protein